MLFQHTSARHRHAFTLVDVMAAVLLIAIALAGVFAANARAMSVLRSAKQAAVASKCLQQRIEQVRNYNWTQVTDTQSMLDLYATPPLPSIELPGFSERVIISGFTRPASYGQLTAIPAGQVLQVDRDVNGLVTPNGYSSSLPDVADGAMVRVDVRIQWPNPNGGLPRTREASVILANGGIGR